MSAPGSVLLARPPAGLWQRASWRGASCRPKGAFTVRADSGRVQQLLKRDQREADVVDPAAFDNAPVASSSEQPTVAAAEEVGSSKPKQAKADRPQRSREAIDLGLAQFQAGDYRAAIELFEQALELPGSGVMRMSGSVREYSCPSEGEEHAALYNMACAYARLGQPGPALTCLEGLLDSGFEDYASIRADPDLAPVRGPQLDQLLAKRDNLLTKILGKKNRNQEGVGKKNQWISW